MKRVFNGRAEGKSLNAPAEEMKISVEKVRRFFGVAEGKIRYQLLKKIDSNNCIF